MPGTVVTTAAFGQTAIMSDKKPPPIALDASFLTPLPVTGAEPPAAKEPASAESLGLSLDELDDSDEGAPVVDARPAPAGSAPAPVAAAPVTLAPAAVVTPPPPAAVVTPPPPAAVIVPDAPVIVPDAPAAASAGLGLAAGDLDDSDEGAPVVDAAPASANLDLTAGDLDDSDEGAPVVEATPTPAKPKKVAKDGLEPLDLDVIPEQYRKHVDMSSPPPVRLAAARAMVPMGPKDMVHVVYQCIFDDDPKIAQLAKKSFKKLDDRILGSVLGDATVQPPVLGLLARTCLTHKDNMETLLANRSTPDSAFVYVAKKSEEHSIIGMIASNQERAMRCHDIVRGIKKNPKALRSDLDKAIDFLVRQGVFLEDVPEFEDSFIRLGKTEMLDALKRIEVKPNDLTEEQLQMAAAIGVSPEEFLLGNHENVEQLEAELKAKHEAEKGPKAAVPMGKKQPKDEEDENESKRRKPLGHYPIPLQIKMAMVGDHACAMEALKSTNRLVASAAIRNPRIKDSDIPKIVYSKSMHDDVIRYICNNGDWTKSYSVKKGLIMNPKTPMSLVLRWMALLRPFDLKQLSKSKQVPSAVSVNAKRLLQNKGG